MRVHALVMGAHTPVRPYDRAGMVHVRMTGAHTQGHHHEPMVVAV